MALSIDDEVELAVVDVKAVAKGYRVSALIKSDVLNSDDETIGEIDDLIVGNEDNALFVIIQVGGFLGFGGRLIAIPFRRLVIRQDDDVLNIVLPGGTRESLERLPAFEYVL
jgi:hypothetical protein